MEELAPNYFCGFEVYLCMISKMLCEPTVGLQPLLHETSKLVWLSNVITLAYFHSYWLHPPSTVHQTLQYCRKALKQEISKQYGRWRGPALRLKALIIESIIHYDNQSIGYFTLLLRHFNAITSLYITVNYWICKVVSRQHGFYITMLV